MRIVDLSLPSRAHLRWWTEVAVVSDFEEVTDLDRLDRDRGRFVTWPLKPEGGDGAPARAIAILD